jgi:MraZ protein
VEEAAKPQAVDPPWGIYPGKVDDKGRLKLPVDFQQYLSNAGDTKVFITSFDARIARIYPISVWKEIAALLKDPGDDAETAEDLWFTANDLGGSAELDSQGRLMMPAELRRALNIENQPVHLEHYKGHIKVFSNQVYEERKQRAAENRAEKLKAFERKGLL